MSIIPRSIKVFLFMLGVLACIVINSRDRFDHLQFIYLIGSTFLFTISTWIITSIRLHRLQPSTKRLVLVLPGFCLALAGLILFAFGETEENYWYTHSLWHILIASSILFFLPHRDLVKKGIVLLSSFVRFSLIITYVEVKDNDQLNLPLRIRNRSGY